MDLKNSTSELTENDYFCLAVDPGETTGWAIISKNGDPTDVGQVPGGAYGGFKDYELGGGMAEFLHHSPRILFKPKLIIYEGYRINSQDLDAHRWSECEAAQVIGVLKGYAALAKAKLIKQQPSALQAARSMTQLFPKGIHDDNHWSDALNHGLFGMMKEKLIAPGELRHKAPRNPGGKSGEALLSKKG